MVEIPAVEGESNDTTVARLVDEIDHAFSLDRWALLPTAGGTVRLYTGAGLRHTTYLMTEIHGAAARGADTIARILGRAQFEATLVTQYLHHGGETALDAIGADYHATLISWAADINQFNAMVAAEKRRIAKRNKAIRKSNTDRAAYNLKHPDGEQLELIAELPQPGFEPIDLDLTHPIYNASVIPPARLPLRGITQPLNALLRDKGDLAAAMEVSYNYVYRSLSTFGAHTNLSVLDSYITDRERNFLRLSERSTAPPMADAIEYTSIVLTAFLAMQILEPEVEHGLLPVAAAVWQKAEERANPAEDEDAPKA